jgi:hypothetical protein
MIEFSNKVNSFASVMIPKLSARWLAAATKKWGRQTELLMTKKVQANKLNNNSGN